MKKLLTLKDAKNLKGKRVLVRVDFNVAIKNKKVVEDTRLKASLPTIKYLSKKGAQVILVTHIGRPEGKFVEELSVKPVAKALEKLLGKNVKLLSEIVVQSMKNGEIALLENIRFFEGEENNEVDFAQGLASIADLFVLDGFAVAHRGSPSVSGVAKYIPAYAGLLLEKEIEGLNKAIQKPKSPAVFVIGGAKIETKLPVIKNILKVADTILVGGAIINTYLQAKGYGVGASLVDKDVDAVSLKAFANKKVITPVDVIVGDKEGKHIRVVEIGKKSHEICNENEAILDIGPETIELFNKHIKKAKTIVWNGAMGLFEVPAYANGTFEVVRAIADRTKKGAYTVVGGGESIIVLNKLKITKHISLISTGGGAMLEYLAGKKLPGIVALK